MSPLDGTPYAQIERDGNRVDPMPGSRDNPIPHDDMSALLLYDISDVFNPVELNAIPTHYGSFFNMVVGNGCLYIVDDFNLTIYDFTEPETHEMQCLTPIDDCVNLALTETSLIILKQYGFEIYGPPTSEDVGSLRIRVD